MCLCGKYRASLLGGWLASPRFPGQNSTEWETGGLFHSISLVQDSPFLKSTIVTKPALLGVVLRAPEIVCLEDNAVSFHLKRCPDLWVAHD